MAPRGANQVLRIVRTVRGVKTVEVVKDPAVMESYWRRYQEREVMNMHGKLDELKPTGDTAKDALQKQAYVHYRLLCCHIKYRSDRLASWRPSRISKRIKLAVPHGRSTPSRPNAVSIPPTRKRSASASAVLVAVLDIPKRIDTAPCSSITSLRAGRSALVRQQRPDRRLVDLEGLITLLVGKGRMERLGQERARVRVGHRVGRQRMWKRRV